jgi:hypothetical protein
MEKIKTIRINQTDFDPFRLHYQFIDGVKRDIEPQDDDPRGLRVEEADQREQDAKDMDGFDMLRIWEEDKL